VHIAIVAGRFSSHLGINTEVSMRFFYLSGDC